MPLTPVNRGAAPNDGTGDTPYDAFGKVNANDTYLEGVADAAQADIDAHELTTTAVHGIPNTADLETEAGAQAKANAAQSAAEATAAGALTVHEADTTAVHGIADTAALVVGPASATDGAVALYDGVTGKLLKDGPGVGVAGGVATLDGLSAGVERPFGMVNGYPTFIWDDFRRDEDGTPTLTHLRTGEAITVFSGAAPKASRTRGIHGGGMWGVPHGFTAFGEGTPICGLELVLDWSPNYPFDGGPALIRDANNYFMVAGITSNLKIYQVTDGVRTEIASQASAKGDGYTGKTVQRVRFGVGLTSSLDTLGIVAERGYGTGVTTTVTLPAGHTRAQYTHVGVGYANYGRLYGFEARSFGRDQ